LTTPDGLPNVTPGNTWCMGEMSRPPVPLSELIRRVSDGLSTLVRDELALAWAEMSENTRRVGIGAGLLCAAGVTCFLGAIGVLAAMVLLLAKVMPAWAAALVVGGVLLLMGAAFALIGRGQVRRAGSVVPQSALVAIRVDLDTVRTAVEKREAQR
jgi:uncharacterized membrane protein YqjE